jgi:Domain of unknown function (DUF929)
MASSVPPRRASGAPHRPSARQAIRRRAPNRTAAVISVATVLVVAAVLAGAKVLTRTPAAPGADFATGPAPAQVVAAVTTMPLAQQLAAAQTTHTVAPSPVHGAALTMGGKPEVLYIGAEYCPFCAAQRWALVSALSHFGTWSGLEMTHSSSTDAYPDTPTLSFRTATYTSPYLSFQAVEETTNQQCQPGSPNCGSNGYQLLQAPSGAERQLLNGYDQHGYIPFIDLGGADVLIGASYDPQVLAGQTPEQVARCLGQPETAEAKEIGAAAAAITKSLCQITAGMPTRTCSSV